MADDRVTIERDASIPQPRGHRKYLWHSLPVAKGNPPKGPFFLVHCEFLERKRVWNSLTRCKNRIEHNYPPKKFVTRAVKGGIGVWRVK